MDVNDLSQIWHASVKGAPINKEQLRKFKIKNAAESVIHADLSLRSEGHVMYGISQICNSKAEMLLDESERVDENTGASFIEYQQQLLEDGPNKRQRVENSLDLLDLDTRDLPLSLETSAPRNVGDLSMDINLRDDELVGDTTADMVLEPRSEADTRAITEELNFDDLINSEELPDMDFGPDPDSSSPPHTPIDEDTHIKKPKRRAKSAPINDVLNLKRPPKSKLLRKLLPELAPEEPESQPEGELYIRLDDATEQLLDPNFVTAKMRQINSSHMMVEDEENIYEPFDDIMEPESETEDTEEQLAVDAEKARLAVKSSLKLKGDTVHFSELAFDRKARACTLMEILHLAGKGRLVMEQETAWSDFTVTKVK